MEKVVRASAFCAFGLYDPLSRIATAATGVAVAR